MFSVPNFLWNMISTSHSGGDISSLYLQHTSCLYQCSISACPTSFQHSPSSMHFGKTDRHLRFTQSRMPLSALLNTLDFLFFRVPIDETYPSPFSSFSPYSPSSRGRITSSHIKERLLLLCTSYAYILPDLTQMLMRKHIN